MKTISTLVDDIYSLVKKQEVLDISPKFAENVASHYKKQLTPRDKEREKGKLYFSEVGERCARKLWWRYHGGVEAMPLTPATRVKFLYGDMLEELVLQLARDAGHCVEQEQGEVKYEIEGTGYIVSGRIDAVIDGAVVDVKSVTKYSEQKFHNGLVDDPFNYFSQLNGYACTLKSPVAGFLTIQKELGHINYFPIVPDLSHWQSVTRNAVKVVEGELPTTRYDLVPQSKTSKNLKLPTECSYCDYKKVCWADANDGEGLKGYAYSDKVVWLAQVFDEPRVPLITGDENEDD
jgi:CRISPR/Cas system-associated exonuclease Cas4 (RecB family)